MLFHKPQFAPASHALHWLMRLVPPTQAARPGMFGIPWNEMNTQPSSARPAGGTAVLRYGMGHFASVRGKLVQWMQDHEYQSIQEMQGSMSLRAVPEPAAFERANYMRVLSGYTLKTAAR